MDNANTRIRTQQHTISHISICVKIIKNIFLQSHENIARHIHININTSKLPILLGFRTAKQIIFTKRTSKKSL